MLYCWITVYRQTLEFSEGEGKDAVGRLSLQVVPAEFGKGETTKSACRCIP